MESGRRPTRRAIDGLLLMVATAVAALTPCARGEGFSGTVSLRIENALPFEPRSARPGRPHQDVLIDLVCRDGKFDEGGWAFVAAMCGLEHEARVVRQEWLADRIKLDVVVSVRSELPVLTGGKATFALDLAVSGDEARGTYKGAIEAPDEAQKLELWYSLGGKKPVGFKGGVVAGRTQSLTHLARPGVVWGVRDQLPIWATGWLAPAVRAGAKASERPVLLGGAGAVSRMKQRAASGDGRRVVEQIRKLVDGAPGGGLEAVGWATLHVIEGTPEHVRRAGEAARRAMDRAPSDARIAREVAALAMAHDLLGGAWEQETGRQVRRFLVQQAQRLAAMEQGSAVAGCVFAAGQALAGLDGPHDFRLAVCRAAAGMAALTLAGDKAVDAQRAEMEKVEQVARRSIRRFLEQGIGDRGAGTGNNGLSEAVEMVYPFVQAWRAARGEDLAEGTGARWTAVWGMMTRGLAFNRGEGFGRGPWLAAGAGLVESRYEPAVAWYWAAGAADVSDPWHGLWMLHNAPAEGPRTKPSGALPLTLMDRRMGSLVTRSGWDDARDSVLIFEMASGAAQAAPMRGNFSLWAMGREWVRRAPSAAWTFGWPATSQQNVLQVLKSEMTRRGEAEFEGGGILSQARARRNGSASISMATRGFVEDSQDDPQLEESKSWRTLGVDYSGVSGAPAMLMMVEGAVGLMDRQQVWEIDVGDVGAQSVKIDGLTFEVKRPGSKGSLKGTFLYPTTVFIQYAPPKDGAGGRIRAFREKPGEKSLDALWKKIDAKLDAQIDAMLKDQDSNIDPAKFDLPLEEENTALKERLQRQNEIVYVKLLRETSSVKMGAPDRRPRAKGNLVVVLTVQEGAAPAVKLLDTKTEALVQVGDQQVTYRENLIEFAREK